MGVLAVPFLRFMFQFSGGMFTAENVLNTAFALYFYCIGIFAYGAIHLASRAFYAYQDTKTPVFLGAVAVAVNIVCSLLLVKVLAQGGLALAYSIAGIVNFLLLMVFLRRKLGSVDGRHIAVSALKTLFASTVMGLCAFGLSFLSGRLLGTASKFAQGVQLIGAGAISVLIFILIAKAIHMEEADAFLAMMKRRLFRHREPGR